MIELLNREFIPVTAHVNHLQRQDDDEGRFFRLISRQGRFGLTYEHSLELMNERDDRETHQGLFVATTGGKLLGSKNTRDPDVLLEMVKGALQRWHDEDDAEPPVQENENLVRDAHYRWEYPQDGLVLHHGCVDLPRQVELRDDDWRRDAHNQDYVWMTREEMLSLVPDGLQEGDSFPVPEPLARRLARFHLLDSVRGENHNWPREAIREMELFLEVTALNDTRISMRVSGRLELWEEGEWCSGPPRDARLRRQRQHLTAEDFRSGDFRMRREGVRGSRGGICCLLNEQGYEPELLGYLEFDRERQRFDRFDVVAVGTRWGGTQHNGRRNDPEPAPLGIGFTIAGQEERDRTPPHASLRAYFNA